MADLTPPRVTLNRPKTRAVLRRNQWAMACDVADLPRWRAFYAKLAKKGPVQAIAYTPWVTQIDAAIREAGL